MCKQRTSSQGEGALRVQVLVSEYVQVKGDRVELLSPARTLSSSRSLVDIVLSVCLRDMRSAAGVSENKLHERAINFSSRRSSAKLFDHDVNPQRCTGRATIHQTAVL